MDKYFELLDKHCQFDYSLFAHPHLSRAHTFKYVFNEMSKIEYPIIIELGTTRSFVNGGLEGCMSPDIKYWQPNNPEAWDWGAGCFTRVFGELLKGELNTVDINSNHIKISQKIVEDFPNVVCHVSDSAIFLQNFPKQANLIYMDVGDMIPLEPTARLHERDANVIIRNNLVKIGGYILVDDVKNPYPIEHTDEKSLYGKAKYSIGVFLANGYEIIMDEYQLLLQRKK